MAEELVNSENEFSSEAGAPERQQSDASYNERTQTVFVSAYAAERIARGQGACLMVFAIMNRLSSCFDAFPANCSCAKKAEEMPWAQDSV
jgi:hypothetical protein